MTTALQEVRVDDTQYTTPYRNAPRNDTLVGVAFAPDSHNLGNWLSEKV